LQSKNETAKFRHRRNYLAQQCDPFSINGWTGVDANSREIAARVSQTFGDPLLNGVASYHYDRNTQCQLFEDYCARANDEDDIRVAPNDFRRKSFGAGRVLLSAVTFDLEILSLNLPQSPKLGE
jgi:hypothetical protein